MNDLEKYHFDLSGFLLVKNLLQPEVVNACLQAIDALENHFAANVDKEPFFVGHYNIRFHFDAELGCSSYKTNDGGGIQYIIEDFLNASPAFDALVGHEPTMTYVNALSHGPFHITSSEIRIRHKNNITPTHMGGPIDARNRYEFIGRNVHDTVTGHRPYCDFNLPVVRILYALHNITLDNGPFCAVPGSHKSNLFSPYGSDPTKEPGMIGIPMEPGDALFFTENLRHGGFPNRTDIARKTIHMQYAPNWMGTQSAAHWNTFVYVLPAALERYSEEQRGLFHPLASQNFVIRTIKT